jgi:hypothetical protein
VFVTFDEGEIGGSFAVGEDCTKALGDTQRASRRRSGSRSGRCHRASCRVPTIVISPTTRPGTASGLPFTHYSLLKTTEQLLGIPEHLGRAKETRTRSLRSRFRL